MDPYRDGEPFGGEPSGDDRLSHDDRRAILTLERSARTPGLRGWWRRIKFRVMVAWGTRVALWGGVVVCLAALATMWEQLSSHVLVAVAGEVVLTAGALLLAYGLRLWWYWGRVNRPPPG
jgi:hypothetical protein